MTEDERDLVCDKINSEGFGYCFTAYSSFQDIDDPEFHRLRENYTNAAEELANFLGVSCID